MKNSYRSKHTKFVRLSSILLLELLSICAISPAFARMPSLISFKPPESDAPERTVGGGSRPSSIGLCPQDRKAIDKPLTAFLSAKENAVTLSSHPTFFVYLPETEAEKVALTISDATESYYYETHVSLERKSGVVGISLPQDAPPLVAGNEYRWSATIVCGNTKRPSDPYVAGMVKRIAADADSIDRLTRSSWSEKVSLYESKGIWYDALSTIALWKSERPDDSLAAASWDKILKSVGLERMSAETLIMSLVSDSDL